MTEIQFGAAPFNKSENLFDNEYTNARYAPKNGEKVGAPFMLYKQPADYMTDWNPSSQAISNLKKQTNLPTDNTRFRNITSANGVNLQNNTNINWVQDTQGLYNVNSYKSCSTDADCANIPGTKCNPNFQSWGTAFGNQGNYCAKVSYPELESGNYIRTDASGGGIGKACNTDNDCDRTSGYYCNNQTDIFGKNVQQTGYCSQKYDCGEQGSYFLGYPYNASSPINPPKDQNNGGQGYTSPDECNNVKSAMQECVKSNNGNWFATYPGFCPMPASLRSGGNRNGALPSANNSVSADRQEIKIPAYASNLSSVQPNEIKAMSALSPWNMNSSETNTVQMSEPLAYELSLNPK